MGQWQLIRDVTVQDLAKTYSRLGVKFDEYHGEAMYGKDHIETVIQRLKDSGIARELSDGRLVAEISSRPESEKNSTDENYNKSGEKMGEEDDGRKQVIIVKRDGTTLYISRDIAATLDRVVRYNFDKMFYVVENGQSDHFQNLFAITEKLENKALNMEHVKFGRIQGMC